MKKVATIVDEGCNTVYKRLVSKVILYF